MRKIFATGSVAGQHELRFYWPLPNVRPDTPLPVLRAGAEIEEPANSAKDRSARRELNGKRFDGIRGFGCGLPRVGAIGSAF